MRAAGIAGEILPWRDVLHDGPVPSGLAPAELAAVRAVFIAESGWDYFAHVLRSFRDRDQTLEQLAAYGEVVLWFEHDLYDQLQLIQALDRIASSAGRPARLSMTVEADFLSMMAPDRLRGLYDARRPVTDAELGAASRAWAAFREPDPTALAGLTAADLAALPFLHSAIGRMLEEYPAPGSGLSRTDEQILSAVAAGAASPGLAFSACQAREAAAFMGDASFWRHVHSLLTGPLPLLRWTEGAPPAFPPVTFDDRRFLDHGLEVTANGCACLAGRLDHAAVNGCRRWLGGVRQWPGRVWRYDRVAQRLIAPAAPDPVMPGSRDSSSPGAGVVP